MGAGKRRHEDAPKRMDERVISEERLSWIETPETGESGALTQEQAQEADQRPEIASRAALERDETRERLLCAISDTEIAKRIRDLMPADPHTPACAEPPKTPFPSAGAKAQPSAGVMQAAPASRPTRRFMVQTSPVVVPMPDSILEKDKTRYRLLRAISEGGYLGGEIPASNPQFRHLVQTSPQAASVSLMPLATAPPHRPVLPEPDSTAEEDKTRDRLLRAISETEIAGQLGGEIPASHSQLRHPVQASPQVASVPLMPPAPAAPHERVSATPTTIEAADWVEVPQVPPPPQAVAVAESAPEVTTPSRAMPAPDRSPRTTILVRCSGEINRLGAKLALTTKSTSRALWQLSVLLKERVAAKAALATKSMGRTATELSIQFKNWMETKGAPAMERLGRSVRQLSVRVWNWAEARAALAMESMGRSQLSTGQDEHAQATQSAPAMESVGQSRSQSPTGLKRWFDPRRSSRLAKPPVVAYCWTADTPHPVKIADISSGGVYLLTDARWPRGGVLSMTLQRTDRTSETPESWIVIDFIVTRFCNDGVAGAFIPSTHGLSRSIPGRAENCADDRTLKRFVRHLAVADAA